MPKYSYQAFNETGKSIAGVIDADSPETANAILSARGFVPTKLVAAKHMSSGFQWRNILEKFSPIRGPELILFTKQFKTLFRAGVPMMKLLKVLESQTENPKLQKVINAISHDIKEGAGLHEAFQKHPTVFSPLYCSMVKAGEASGALSDVLERLEYMIEHEFKIKSDIKAAMQYPVFVLMFLAVAFFILLTFVLPKFVKIFVTAGIALPWPTKVSISLYQFMVNYWYLLIGSLVVGATALIYYSRTPKGRYTIDTFLLNLPILGQLLRKAAMSRFASIFSILQSSGVGVLEAMKILSGTIGNTAIASEFDRINERLEEGRGIAEPLQGAKYFTPIVVNMVAIGEESGNLDELLRDISTHYDAEVEYATQKLSDAVGPILTIGLAALVGFFALSIFLPMWDLSKMIR